MDTDSTAPPPQDSPDRGSEHVAYNAFPIVGIGASAGGLDALSTVLAHLPAEPGMALVLIQHLDPHHESRLVELLARTTALPVLEATEGLAVRANHVYVIAPNTSLTIAAGALHVRPRGDVRLHLPIDHFLKSLAEEQQNRAIGVLLSGTGSDGTLGLCDIKAMGGITFGQDERSTKHFGMPRSAIDAGCVDFVLPPDDIARRLASIGRHPYLGPASPGVEHRLVGDQFRRILGVVRASTGVDLSQYRDTTLRRRIARRMALHGTHEMAEYGAILESDRHEVEALYRDLLINVTSFFRDQAMFDALKERAFPRILEGRTSTDAIRVWVPGCSTGQEAYSLAMALVEFLDDKPVRPAIQIFATDLGDPASLERARAGVYPTSIEAELTPERLRRFFTREEQGYRIAREVRELCVFARQNIATDPPFSHVDVISCRNVLMYMGVALQKQVIPVFHYALNAGGFVVLGPSETVGEFGDLFEPIERAHKIYAKRPAGVRPAVRLRAMDRYTPPLTGAARSSARPVSQDVYQNEADRILLGRHAPPGVLVNGHFDVLQFRGRTAPYLESPPGEPTQNVLKMAREGLFVELRSALTEARSSHQAVVRHAVRVRADAGFQDVTVRVTPVRPAGAADPCLLISFEDPSRSASTEPDEPRAAERARPPVLDRLFSWLPGSTRRRPAGRSDLDARDRELGELRQELAAMKEYLQTAGEQQEAMNEELRSANEEILSSNEELQSTNEELETAKEELQSANEELSTVNEQLHNRNLELSVATNDLTNLLSSTNMPMVMVGSDLRVRRLTPAAGHVLNLLPNDVGRPIAHIRPAVDIPPLEGLIEHVIGQDQIWTAEVQDREGAWWQLRIHPYRTSDRQLDGAVIILVDIDEIKRAAERVRNAVEMARLGMWELDIHAGTFECSAECKSAYGLPPEASFGYEDLFRAMEPEDRERTQRRISEALEHSGAYKAEYRVTWPDGSTHWIVSRGRATYDSLGKPTRLTGMTLDLTQRKRTEMALKKADRRKDEFIATLAHELRNPLAPMRFALKLMRESEDAARRAQARDVIERQLEHLVRIVDDLLDVSRIARGKIELRRERVDLRTIVDGAVDATRPLIEMPRHHLTVNLPERPVPLIVDPVRMTQILVNLLSNAAKFTPAGGRISVTAETTGDRDGEPSAVEIRVRDSGIGIPPEFVPQLFQLFSQADHSLARSQVGLGVGLTLVRQLVEMHGGRVAAVSEGPGRGSEFSVHLPVAPEASAAPPDIQAGEEPQPRAALRVLLAEDNVDSADMLALALSAWGHQVRTAHDGPEALDAAADFQPEVAVLDIGLPGMSGYEVARRLRSDARGRDIVLVALTGWGQEGDKRRSREAGFDHHLVKPVDPQTLEALLRTVRPRLPGPEGDAV